MDEQDQHISNLLKQYHEGTISEQEKSELMDWYDSFENSPGYAEGLEEGQRQQIKKEQFLLIEKELDSHEPTLKQRLAFWPRIAVAASVFLCLSLGGYMLMVRQQPAAETASIDKFKAGGNKAELILADGQKIILEHAANGQLAVQGNTVINKTADGKLVYGSREDDSKVLRNTMRTPRGGQYHLVLADGTGVWLNAASSITYPSSFNGNSREVEVTGEIYFEVAHNAAKPFRVKSDRQTVEVLGTHFNINAYQNEAATSTTLLEGSVRVVSGNTSRLIRPGQQALSKGSGIQVKEVDIDEAVAWKDGYFDFTDSDIRSVMRQISRWYDVDIEFAGPVTQEKFTGKIPKTFDLAKTIEVMQLSRSVKLSVQGRRIMVR